MIIVETEESCKDGFVSCCMVHVTIIFIYKATQKTAATAFIRHTAIIRHTATLGTPPMDFTVWNSRHAYSLCTSGAQLTNIFGMAVYILKCEVLYTYCWEGHSWHLSLSILVWVAVVTPHSSQKLVYRTVEKHIPIEYIDICIPHAVGLFCCCCYLTVYWELQML